MRKVWGIGNMDCFRSGNLNVYILISHIYGAILKPFHVVIYSFKSWQDIILDSTDKDLLRKHESKGKIEQIS